MEKGKLTMKEVEDEEVEDEEEYGTDKTYGSGGHCRILILHRQKANISE